MESISPSSHQSTPSPKSSSQHRQQQLNDRLDSSPSANGSSASNGYSPPILSTNHPFNTNDDGRGIITNQTQPITAPLSSASSSSTTDVAANSQAAYAAAAAAAFFGGNNSLAAFLHHHHHQQHASISNGTANFYPSAAVASAAHHSHSHPHHPHHDLILQQMQRAAVVAAATASHVAAAAAATHRRRKARTVFSDHQLHGLEKRYVDSINHHQTIKPFLLIMIMRTTHLFHY